MRKLISKSGDRLYKKAKAKIFLPGNQKHIVRERRAPAGQGLTDDGVTSWLKHLSDAIEKQWPNQEYRMVEIGQTSFNFVWVREITESEAVVLPTQSQAEAVSA